MFYADVCIQSALCKPICSFVRVSSGIKEVKNRLIRGVLISAGRGCQRSQRKITNGVTRRKDKEEKACN